ncbi:MAG: Translation initiation factor IF-3 [Microgenomates bacterium 39_7]|nr:MAG: Translation initiation factor IF-3 [Microgenomates bacterium 39_7]
MARYSKREYVVANHKINFPQIRVLNEQGKMIGIMSSREAIELAQKEGKDLVLVTREAQPPVTKIIELSKYKYQQQQKQAKARKKSRTQELKEVRFKMFMGDNDVDVRKKRVKEFLEEGNKVRMSLEFRGRQISKKEFAYELFAQVINEVQDEELGKLEIEPKINGRKLIAQLTPV